jgi:hypothetical protein
MDAFCWLVFPVINVVLATFFGPVKLGKLVDDLWWKFFDFQYLGIQDYSTVAIRQQSDYHLRLNILPVGDFSWVHDFSS